jgi:hypothetical protein
VLACDVEIDDLLCDLMPGTAYPQTRPASEGRKAVQVHKFGFLSFLLLRLQLLIPSSQAYCQLPKSFCAIHIAHTHNHYNTSYDPLKCTFSLRMSLFYNTSYSIISENLDISFSRMRIVKLVFVLFGSIHLFTCAFWRVKVTSNLSQNAL